MGNDERHQPQPETGSARGLDFVYNDLGARLSNDDRNSWNLVSLAGVLLTLLLAFTPDELPSPAVEWVAFLTGVFLGLAMIAGIVSLFVYRDFSWMPLKRLVLGGRGHRAFRQAKELVGSGYHLELFHTLGFLGLGVSADARADYRRAIDDSFEDQLTRYLFFMAHLIEIKKGPRTAALVLLLIGAVLLLIGSSLLLLPAASPG